MTRISLGLGAALLVVASAAAAHPGHGLGGSSWLHYATDPLHVAPVALIGLALALAGRRRARARASR